MLHANVSAMDPVAERKFKNLRRRLDQLGYRQPLGIETVPLVEKLFSDLVHTTESFKKTKLQLGSQEKEKDTHEDRVGPYKADNARLVKEVNKLHLELIRRKDAMDSQVKQMKHNMRNIETQNSDLRFLNTQYAQKIRSLERESELKSERIQRLLEKNLHAVVETEDGARKRQIATRRQRMTMTSMAPPSQVGAATTQPPLDTPKQTYSADLLQLADTKMAEMEEHLKRIEDDKTQLEVQLQTVQSQVERREDEIERLGRLLEGGRPVSSVMADSNTEKEERQMKQLQHQVEYLQGINKGLEDELVTTATSNEDLMTQLQEMNSKHEAMAKELGELDKLSRELQQEKLAANSQNQRELRKQKMELSRQQGALAAKLSEAQAAIHKNTLLKGEIEHLTKMLAKSESALEKLQIEFTSLEEDNMRLATLANMSYKSGMNKKQSAGGKDFRDRKAGKDDHHYDDDNDEVANLKAKIANLEATNRDLHTVFESVELEREFFKREAAKLGSGEAGDFIPVPNSDAQVTQLQEECDRYRKEVESLSGITRRLEMQLNDNMSEIKSLQSERERLLVLYRQAVGANAASEPKEKESIQRMQSQLNDFEALLQSREQEIKNLQTKVAYENESRNAIEKKARKLEDLLNAHTNAKEREMGEERTVNQALRGEINQANSEISRLQGIIQKLDAERDQLVQEADMATEQAAAAKQTHFTEHQEIEKLHKDLSAKVAESAARAASLESCKHELSKHKEELQRMTRERDILGEKVQQQQMDMDLITQEHQTVNSELESLASEQRGTENTMENLRSKVEIFEKMLQEKDKSLQEMMTSYRATNSEIEKMEARAMQAEKEMHTLRNKLSIRDTQLNELKERLRSTVIVQGQMQENLQVVEGERRALQVELQVLRSTASSVNGHGSEQDLYELQGVATPNGGSENLSPSRHRQVGDTTLTQEGRPDDASLELQLRSSRVETASLNRKLTNLSTENQELRQTLNDLTSRIHQFITVEGTSQENRSSNSRKHLR
eukprot:m.295055 g.295055  ORF g.295055 m.295055 type:complete len:1015 (+) comp16393_c0_seq1:294-3338(+)